MCIWELALQITESTIAILYEVTSTIEDLASFRYQRREEIEATESLCSAKIQRFSAMFARNALSSMRL